MNALDVARLAWRTFTKSYPEQVVFFVTARCNFRCKMCFYAKEAGGDELTLDEYDRISRHMPAFHWMMISGGEPFLRDDLAKICRLFIARNRVCKINLPTNAYHTERIVPAVEEILKISPRCFLNLGPSLHAVGKAHDEVTGVPGSFDRAMETYRALQPLRKRFKNFGLAVPIIHCGYNEGQVRELISYIFDTLDIDDICINLVRGEPRMEGARAVSPEQYEENIQFLHGLINRHRGYYFKLPLRGLYVSKDILLRELILKTLREKRYQIPCYAGRISAVIDEHGGVHPCELRRESFGNLREAGYDFRTVWRSPARRDSLSRIAGERCFCTHECFNTTNILFNPRLWFHLVRTWGGLRREWQKAGEDG